MIFLAGDIHGNLEVQKVVDFFEAYPHPLSKADTLILLGDTAICWDDGPMDAQLQLVLQTLPVTVAFVDGNHENHDLLNNRRVVSWKGGLAHQIREDIYHLMRGEVFTLEGKTFFTFGGGYSVDCLRRTPGLTWWEREMPGKEEYQKGLANLQAHGNRVNYILTHTAPSWVLEQELFELFEGEEPLQEFLDEVAQCVTYDHWYCGHFHVDATPDATFTMVYNNIIAL